MTLRLLFDFVPSVVEPGQPFEVAVLLVNEDDEPQIDGIDGEEPIAVTLATTTNCDDSTSSPFTVTKTVEGGEALFSDIVMENVSAEMEAIGWSFTAKAEGMEMVVSDFVEFSCEASATSGGKNEDGTTPSSSGATDEEITDAGVLATQIKRSVTGGKMRHYLMLTKGRMWGRSDNADRLANVGLAKIINDVLLRCDQDEAIECIALIQELLSNPTGGIVHTCAGCRAAIRPEPAKPRSIVEQTEGGVEEETPIAVETPSGLVFHSDCLLCQECQRPIGLEPFVRNVKLQPFHHSTCRAGVGSSGTPSTTTVGESQEWEDSAPLHCKPLLLRPVGCGGAAGYCEAVEQFLTSKTQFMTTLKAKHYADDNYVYDRVRRMLLRIPADISEQLADLKNKRD